MKVTIISGGSGNNALYKGIKSFYPECDIKVLINAYDAGKSTGICRKVTHTLGVSDIRKNHSRLYSMSPTFNQNYYDFLEARYDLRKGYELEDVLEHLKEWELDNDTFVKAAEYFFSKPEAKLYNYASFNIGNIIYASMFEQYGYDFTFDFVAKTIGFDQNVILNSYDNIYIGADTESGHWIDDEGIIVDWQNANDKITNITYTIDGKSQGVNPLAVNALKDSDLIIISTGTFWSSIFPTFEYLELYKAFNESNAKKIWVMNNEQDKDSYGVSAADFVDIMKKLGVDTSKIDLIINSDANDLLKKVDGVDCNVHTFAMGNTKGKHDADKVCNAILKIYVDAKDTIVLDFDDTIWSRLAMEVPALYKTSVENVKLLNEVAQSKKVYIISGNSYSSIKKKLSKVYGSKLGEFKPIIIADANSVIYSGGEKVGVIDELVISDNDRKAFSEFVGESIKYDDTESYLKIKPINENREFMSKLLNAYFAERHLALEAKVTGYTTIDILKSGNTKAITFNSLNITGDTTYIGDEVDNGNDKEIASLATNYYQVDNIYETNTLLLSFLYNIK